MKEFDKFIVKHKDLDAKEEPTITMTLRIDRDLRAYYDDLSIKSGRSRNELMNLALKYAIRHLEFMDK